MFSRFEVRESGYRWFVVVYHDTGDDHSGDERIAVCDVPENAALIARALTIAEHLDNLPLFRTDQGVWTEAWNAALTFIRDTVTPKETT